MMIYISPLLTSYLIGDRLVLWTWSRLLVKTEVVWKSGKR